MSNHKKTLEKLKSTSPSSSIKWSELNGVLGYLGYEPIKCGKTSGSRRKFYNIEKDLLILCHEPHKPANVDKGCIADIVKQLEEHGFW
jgi:hypothetical protein